MPQAPAQPEPAGDETRRRLLEAAGEVFAEQGFRSGTVREICSKAGANVAAINYHFRDKQGLYTACLHFWLAEAIKQYPPLEGVTPDAPADKRLAAFIRNFCLRMLNTGRPAWHGRLMAREMVEPTGALDECVEQSIRPLAGILIGIVREILGPRATDPHARLAMNSVVGQILFYVHSRPVIEKVQPKLKFDLPTIEHLAIHITRFSLAGLHQMQKELSRDHATPTSSTRPPER